MFFFIDTVSYFNTKKIHFSIAFDTTHYNYKLQKIHIFVNTRFEQRAVGDNYALSCESFQKAAQKVLQIAIAAFYNWMAVMLHIGENQEKACRRKTGFQGVVIYGINLRTAFVNYCLFFFNFKDSFLLKPAKNWEILNLLCNNSHFITLSRPCN